MGLRPVAARCAIALLAAGLCATVPAAALVVNGDPDDYEVPPPSDYDLVGYIVGATAEPIDPCRVHEPVFDVNDDKRVDGQDHIVFESCATGPGIPMPAEAPLECKCMDTNGDLALDQQDFAAFQLCFTGDSPFGDEAISSPGRSHGTRSRIRSESNAVFSSTVYVHSSSSQPA